MPPEPFLFKGKGGTVIRTINKNTYFSIYKYIKRRLFIIFLLEHTLFSHLQLHTIYIIFDTCKCIQCLLLLLLLLLFKKYNCINERTNV
jgi:hypothetical protein